MLEDFPKRNASDEKDALQYGLTGVARLGIQGSQPLCPYLVFTLGGIMVRGLVDTGSVKSLISGKLYQRLLEGNLVKGEEPSSFQCWTASRTALSISRVVSLQMKLEGFSWTWSFLVAENLALECILGADFVA
jgi:hypothetical protein